MKSCKPTVASPLRDATVFAALLCAWPLVGWAQQPVVDASMQSFSGVIETPHAETLESGRLSLSFTDHPPIPGLSDPSPQSATFTFGFLDQLELGGRLTEADGLDGGRDLLAHAKLQLFARQGWPSLAVGVQDFQGNRLFGGSAYAVSSWSPWPWLRVNAGYGFREARLDGGFGSIELAPLRYLTLLAEHSDQSERAGASVHVPLFAGVSAHLKGAHDFDLAESTFLAELQLPLGAPLRQEAAAVAPAFPQQIVVEPGVDALVQGLRAAGYRSIRTEVSAGLALVCVDYGRSFRSPVDAIGVAFGLMDARLPGDGQDFRVVLEREGQAQIAVTMPRQAYRRLLQEGDTGASGASARWANGDECDTAAAASNEGAEYEAVLSPNLVTFYATEFGELDADLALRLRLQANYGDWGVFFVSLLSPAARTEDLERGEAFGEQRSRSGVDQALYQLYLRPAPNWSMLTSLGFMRVFHNDAAAVLQEHLISSESGRHAFRLHAGGFAGSRKTLSIAVADYIWQWPEQEMRFSIGGGRFAAGDTGARAELTRYFGDTTLSLFVRGRDRYEAVGGVTLSVPLVPRFWASDADFRLRGAERWRHSAGSSFSDRDGSNPIRPRLLIEPLPDRNLRDTYVDLDRAAPDWILEQTWRMREAYLDQLVAP